MSRSERDKGAAGEREVAAIFRGHGFDCDRVPNSGGLRLKGDLYGALPVHVEVKRQERAQVWAWWQQAVEEAPEGVRPVLAFRRNRSEWLAVVRLDDLVGLLAKVMPTDGQPAARERRDVEIDLDIDSLRRKHEIEMKHRGCRIALSKWAIRFERLEAQTERLREVVAACDVALNWDERRIVPTEAVPDQATAIREARAAIAQLGDE